MEPSLLLKVMCVSGESYDIHAKFGIVTCVAAMSWEATHMAILMCRRCNPINWFNFVGRLERGSNEGVV